MGTTTVILNGGKCNVREWSKKLGKYVTIPLGQNDILHYLWEVIELKNFRVRDALDILSDSPLWAMILQEAFLPDLLKEHRRLLITKGLGKKIVARSYNGKPMKPFSKIQVSLAGESALYDNSHIRMKFKKDGTLNFNRRMPKKIRKWTEYSPWMDVVGFCGRHRYGVDLCPLAAYWDAKIEVNPNFMLYRTDYTHKSRHYKDRSISLGKSYVTVLEFFKALIYELTFHGSPTMQAKKCREVYGTMEDYKKTDE